MAKRLKLQIKKVLGLIPTFVEVTGENLFGSILNRANGISASNFMVKVHAWMI